VDTRHFYFEVCPLDLIASRPRALPKKTKNGARAEFQKKTKNTPNPPKTILLSYFCRRIQRGRGERNPKSC